MPLAQARAHLLALAPTPRSIAIETQQAVGRVLAESVTALAPTPLTSLALRDGFAVAASDTVGATPYAPIYLFEAPPALGIGAALPDGSDAILPFPTVAAERQPVEIFATVSPGENIRRAGGDFAADTVIRGAGERLRSRDIVLLQQAGIAKVHVAAAEVTIIVPRDARAEQAVAAWLRAAILAEGACAEIVAIDADGAQDFDATLKASRSDLALMVADAQVACAALKLAGGKILAQGLAVAPGESMGCGSLERSDCAMAVGLVPPRPESALAAWLLLLRPYLDRCLGVTELRPNASFPVSRKIVSAPGRADLVLLRRKVEAEGQSWEPLATGDLPWQALTQGEAWHLIPPESEGWPAGELLRAEYF